MNTPKTRVIFFIFLGVIIAMLCVFAYFYYTVQTPTMETTKVPEHLPLTPHDTATLNSIVEAKPQTLPPAGNTTPTPATPEQQATQDTVSQIVSASTSPKQTTTVEASFLQGIIGTK